MNDFNLPSVEQEEVVEEVAEEAVEVVEEEAEGEHRHQHRHQRHPNNQYPSQQTLKLWEDFPKSSTETAQEPMTSSKK
jgi:hypothetical protein